MAKKELKRPMRAKLSRVTDSEKHFYRASQWANENRKQKTSEITKVVITDYIEPPKSKKDDSEE